MDYFAGTQSSAQSGFSRLKRLAKPEIRAERCGLCGAALPPMHGHLLQVEGSKLVCSCEACAILFTRENEGKFRRVPRDVKRLDDFAMTDGQWEQLAVPIDLAFFVDSTIAKKVIAMYPSPAGATESLLPLTAWRDLVDQNPALRDLQKDVEALLVNKTGSDPVFYIVPIDSCFALVGLIRAHWRGLSGGTEVWKQITAYFADLSNRAGGHSEIAGGAEHA